MSRPKLRHLAIAVDNPDEMAAFYMKAFGLEKIGETDSPLATGVYLSDGTICLACLNFKNDKWAGRPGKDYRGIHHMGFWVDDLTETGDEITNAGGTYFTGQPSSDEGDISTLHYEAKYYDPNGTMIDISASGWPGAKRG